MEMYEMQSPAHTPVGGEHQQQQRIHRSKTNSSASSVALDAASTRAITDIKCPELLVIGSDLQKKNVTLQKLYKKGKRFESGWSAYWVAIYANTLFYYEDIDELPRGVVPLAGCSARSVDRIFKNSSDSSVVAIADGVAGSEPYSEDCGPCWKVTSSAGRVLLFRSPSNEDRQLWLDRVNQANVEHPTYRRRSSASSQQQYPHRGSIEGPGRRRRSSSASRHSMDESQLYHVSPEAYQQQQQYQQRHSDASGSVNVGHEVSEMLRDAMQLVKKQKQEILELKNKLMAAQVYAQEQASLAFAASASVSVIAEQVARAEAETQIGVATDDHSEQDEQPKKKQCNGNNGVHDTVEVDIDEIELAPVSETEVEKAEDDEEEVVESPVVVVPAAPLSAPAALPGSGETHSTTFHRSMSTGATDPSAMFAASAGNGYKRASYSGGNEYLQQQAMELAEIARNLQSSFRTDFAYPAAAESAPSAASTYVDTFSQRGSTSEMLNQDMFSFDGDQIFDDGEEDYERLSEFDESDEHFLEASGILDSIQQVMNDFIVTSVPEKQPNQIIISDDVIAEIRQGIERKDAEEARRLRHLRSLSANSSDPTDFLNTMDTSLQRANSARDFSSDFRVGMVLLYPLLRLFGSHNRLSRLIRWAIEIEVASVMNVATLFRSDDYASRLVSSYSKCVGSEFIRVVLTDPLQDILVLKIADLELNPDKDEIPSSYFHICSHLNSKVINRFDGSYEGIAVEDPASLTRSVIGGFLFLRFVCPAITTPHLYNLADKEPPPETRRVLVLVTKLLFKTATCVMFGEREPQFKILNPFIERNSPAIQQLFINLSTPPEQDIDECFAADSRDIFSDVDPTQLESDITVIRTITEKNLDAIAQKLAACGFSPQVTSEFKVAVLAPPGPREVVHPFLADQKIPKAKKLSVNKFLSFGKKMRKPHTDV